MSLENKVGRTERERETEADDEGVDTPKLTMLLTGQQELQMVLLLTNKKDRF